MPITSTYHGMTYADLATVHGMTVGDVGGIGGGNTLPDPLMYHSLDTFGATYSDEIGLLDLDLVADVQAVAGKNGNGIQNTSGNTAVIERVSSGTSYNIYRTMVTAWVKMGATGTVLMSAQASGSATYQWYEGLQGRVPADSSWHHVLLSFSDNTIAKGTIYISVDGAARVDTGGYHIYYVNWNCPHVSASNDAILDEWGHIYLAAEPSASEVLDYANQIYNAGVGRFYRTATGWA